MQNQDIHFSDLHRWPFGRTPHVFLIGRGAGSLFIVLGLLMSACCKPAEFPYSPDRAFATAAATAQENGISAGRFGARYASNPTVRTYAHLLAATDSAADAALWQIADTINLLLPTAPNGQYDSLQTQLAGCSGRAFDFSWLQNQSTALHKVTALYESEIGNGQSPTVQRYAQNWLPAIRQQQQMADSLLNLPSAQ